MDREERWSGSGGLLRQSWESDTQLRNSGRCDSRVCCIDRATAACRRSQQRAVCMSETACRWKRGVCGRISVCCPTAGMEHG